MFVLCRQGEKCNRLRGQISAYPYQLALTASELGNSIGYIFEFAPDFRSPVLQEVLPRYVHLTSAQLGQKLEGRYSVQILAEQVSESRMQIQRYIRLNHLIQPLMDQVDAGKLKFVPAADFISHLSEKEQTYLLMVMERDEVSPSVGQAKRLKEISAEGKLENNIIDLIMREEKPLERKVTLDGNWVKRRFPQSMTPQQIMERINKALDLLEREK